MSPSETNQEVLIGVMPSRWAPESGDFNTFRPNINTVFDRMADFWEEATFGRVSFVQRYLTTSIITLPKSEDFYYHPFRQRNIDSADVPDVINFPQDKTLRILSDGQDIEVEFSAGDWNRDQIKPKVDEEIADASPTEPPPTFEFSGSGSGFNIRTTRVGRVQAKLELEGNAIPYLGFGDDSLFDLGDDGPAAIIFGTSIDADSVSFPTPQDLVVTTLGEQTTVRFAAETLSASEIRDRIEDAFPGESQQQPYEVDLIDDPLDGDRRILVFKTRTDGDDDGFKLTVGGDATSTLGIDGAGVLRRYEPETFRGRTSRDSRWLPRARPDTHSRH